VAHFYGPQCILGDRAVPAGAFQQHKLFIIISFVFRYNTESPLTTFASMKYTTVITLL